MRDLRRRRKNQPCVLCGEFCEDACSAMRASIRRSASRAAAVIDEPAHQVLVRPRLLRNHPGRRGLDALSGRHRGRLLRNDQRSLPAPDCRPGDACLRCIGPWVASLALVVPSVWFWQTVDTLRPCTETGNHGRRKRRTPFGGPPSLTTATASSHTIPGATLRDPSPRRCHATFKTDPLPWRH